MQTRVAKEYNAVEKAMMDLSNAFGYTDEDAEWAGDEENRLEVWEDAQIAAGHLVDAAQALHEVARKRTNALEEALDEDEES